jgi:20S proteasome subunit beta 1
VTDKLTQVHDTIWCCRSGSAADTQAVADVVHYQLGLFSMRNGKPPTTQTAAAIFQEICYANKDQLRCVLVYYPPQTHRVVPINTSTSGWHAHER